MTIIEDSCTGRAVSSDYMHRLYHYCRPCQHVHVPEKRNDGVRRQTDSICQPVQASHSLLGYFKRITLPMSHSPRKPTSQLSARRPAYDFVTPHTTKAANRLGSDVSGSSSVVYRTARIPGAMSTSASHRTCGVMRGVSRQLVRKQYY